MNREQTAMGDHSRLLHHRIPSYTYPLAGLGHTHCPDIHGVYEVELGCDARQYDPHNNLLTFRPQVSLNIGISVEYFQRFTLSLILQLAVSYSRATSRAMARRTKTFDNFCCTHRIHQVIFKIFGIATSSFTTCNSHTSHLNWSCR